VSGILRTAVDVAADEVRVEALEGARAADGAGEDAAEEAGREALDLPLDRVRDVDRAGVRDVPVDPGGVLPRRRARRIREARLGDEDEGRLRGPSAPDLPLRSRDLLERAAEMDDARAAARLRRPGNRRVERVVDLVGRGSVAERLELRAVAGRKPVARDRDELPRRDVKQDGARGRKLVERSDAAPRLDPASMIAEHARERLDHGLRAAPREGPAVRVRRRAEDRAEGGGDPALEGKERVRREAAEERARSFVCELRPRESARRADRRAAEARQRDRIPRDVERCEQVRRELSPAPRERSEVRGPRAPVRAEPRRGRLDRALEDGRRPVVERVGERDPGAQPLDAAALEVQRPEERRARPEREDRGAGVVEEARQRRGLGSGPLRRSAPRPRARGRGVPPARARSRPRARWAGADDDGVRFRRVRQRVRSWGYQPIEIAFEALKVKLVQKPGFGSR
jgi:hypothetical protein